MQKTNRIKDNENSIAVEDEEPLLCMTERDRDSIDIAKDIDTLYLVKWKNLSYREATWEHESELNAYHQITAFRTFNRALDKERRNNVIQQINRHKTLLFLKMNPPNALSRAQCTPAQILDINVKLFNFDQAQHKKVITNAFLRFIYLI